MLNELLLALRCALRGAINIARLANKSNCRIANGVTIRFPKNIYIGEHVAIQSNSYIHCGETPLVQGQPNVVVGDDSYIGPGCVLFGEGGIRIGSHCEIAPGVVITSQQHSFDRVDIPISRQPAIMGEVVIEDDVWIGANASVLPGVHIGRGCVIGAGAVVRSHLAPGSVAVGVPARTIRKRQVI